MEGDLTVCKLDDEEEGRREGRKKGGGGVQLHWYEYDAEAADRATYPLLSPLQPHPSIPTEREERGREGTVSMATAEQS